MDSPIFFVVAFNTYPITVGSYCKFVGFIITCYDGISLNERERDREESTKTMQQSNGNLVLGLHIFLHQKLKIPQSYGMDK